MLSPILINLERLVVVILAAVAFLLAILSFRGKNYDTLMRIVTLLSRPGPCI